MNLDAVLDGKLESFLKNDLDKTTIVAFCSSMVPNPARIIEDIDDFIGDVSKIEHKVYLLRNILDYIDSIEFTEDLVTAYTSYNDQARARFDENIALVNGHIILMLHDFNYKLDDEVFTNEEFESFKEQLSQIAKNLYEFQTRQEAANELIYNSVDELKEELIKNAEKGKIFGKKFVQEQIAGKIMDMTLTGGITNLLSMFSNRHSDLLDFMKGLL